MRTYSQSRDELVVEVDANRRARVLQGIEQQALRIEKQLGGIAVAVIAEQQVGSVVHECERPAQQYSVGAVVVAGRRSARDGLRHAVTSISSMKTTRACK